MANIEEEWAKIPMSTVLNLVHSMPDRLKDVIEAQGGNTDW